MKTWTFVGGMNIKDLDQLCEEFSISEEQLKGTAGVCWSSEPNYSESMRAIFRDAAGQYFEVEASHCSCFGYSEQDYNGDAESQRTQWQPKPVSAPYVRQLAETKASGGWPSELECVDFIEGLKALLDAKEAA